MPRDAVNVISPEKPEVTTSFFLHHQPFKHKSCLLMRHSRMKDHSIQGEALPRRFSSYLKRASEAESKMARVSFLLRVVQRIEKLDKDSVPKAGPFDRRKSIKSKPSLMQMVVEEVVYGVELLCTMRREIHRSTESKQQAEERMYYAAKTYLDQITGLHPSDTAQQPPLSAELDSVDCDIADSSTDNEVGKNKKKNKTSLSDFGRQLKDALNKDTVHPIEFTVGPLKPPTADIAKMLRSDEELDMLFHKEYCTYLIEWINSKVKSISSQPIVEHIPCLKTMMTTLERQLQPVFNKVMDSYRARGNKESSGCGLGHLKDQSELLVDIVDWLVCRQVEIETLATLLGPVCCKNSKLSIPVLDLTQTDGSDNDQLEGAPIPPEGSTFLFLKVDYVVDSIIRKLSTYGVDEGLTETTVADTLLHRPVFLAVSTMDEERKKSLSDTLRQFVAEAETNQSSDEALSGSFQVALVAKTSPIEEGAIHKVESAKSLAALVLPPRQPTTEFDNQSTDDEDKTITTDETVQKDILPDCDGETEHDNIDDDDDMPPPPSEEELAFLSSVPPPPPPPPLELEREKVAPTDTPSVDSRTNRGRTPSPSSGDAHLNAAPLESPQRSSAEAEQKPEKSNNSSSKSRKSANRRPPLPATFLNVNVPNNGMKASVASKPESTLTQADKRSAASKNGPVLLSMPRNILDEIKRGKELYLYAIYCTLS